MTAATVSPHETPSSRHLFTGLLVAVVTLAALLRWYHLAALPFEQDELYTLRDALAFGEGWNARPLYYFVVHLLLAVWPESPLLLRLPAAIFGVLGVVTTWYLARRMFGERAAAVAAVLVAVSPWHLFESQNARYWSLVYLLAALTYVVLPRALERDRHRDYLVVLAVIGLGGLSHPTYVFPIVGVVAALLLVNRDGKIGLVWPSPRAWVGLWGPLLLVAAAAAVVLAATGNLGAYRNAGGRGSAAIVRLVPAMIQWAGPVVIAAAACAVYYLLFRSRPADRRWGLVILLGCGSATVLLFLSSFVTDAYASYGVAALPLVFVGIGGLVQRLAEALAQTGRAFAIGATAVLCGGVLPGTVSHLSDGTRFDYRPAFEFIARAGGDPLVLGWPEVLQRYYAPELRFEEIPDEERDLDARLAANGGFWLIGSYRRYGMVSDNGHHGPWIDAHCRRVQQSQGARLDYRSYRVVLHWCGPEPFPGSTRPAFSGVGAGSMEGSP
jgi:hypothetical protein